MKMADIVGPILTLVEHLAEAIIARAKEKHPTLTHNAVIEVLRDNEDELAGMLMNVALAKLAERAADVTRVWSTAEARGKAAGAELGKYVQREDPTPPSTPTAKADNGDKAK